MREVKEKRYTTQFWFLCVSSLLFFASFNMLIPELPDYLSKLGGAEYKGLIISLFTLTAMVSRPFSGKLADRIGRKPVIYFGTGVCMVCSLLYPFLTTVFGFFLLRLVHGFSTGFSPTGVAAYISDVIPAQRRGEAMGFIGTAGAVGTAGGPSLAGIITNYAGMDAMFYMSSALALVSILILLGVNETVKEKHDISIYLLNVRRSDLFEPLVIAPCLVMVLSAYAYGAMYTLMPDFGRYVGISNKGYLFTVLTLASLLVRLLAGRASDLFGRVAVLKVSVLLMVVSMVVTGLASTEGLLIIGVALYGLAQGSTSPTLLAWATDLSDEEHKGRGISSLYISMEMGIGLGALLSGFIYHNNPEFFVHSFMICAFLCVAALFYLYLSKK